MRWNNHLSFIAMNLSLLLISSCINSTDNTTSKIKNSLISKSLTVDSTSISTKTSALNEHEIIGGWIKEQTDQQVVLDKLGIPEKKGDDVNWAAIDMYVQKWKYISLGIELEMSSENQGGLKKVIMITITQPCKLSTSQGISIGSNENTVRKKYFKLINSQYSDKETIVIGTIYGGTIFTLKNGIVSKIFIGAAAE